MIRCVDRYVSNVKYVEDFLNPILRSIKISNNRTPCLDVSRLKILFIPSLQTPLCKRIFISANL